MMKTIKLTKYTLGILAIGLAFLTACEDDDNGTPIQSTATDSQASVNLTQFVNGVALEMNTADLRYTNAMNQQYNVTRLQYLISDITFHRADGSAFTIEEFHYLDLSNPSTTVFNPETRVPNGDYSSISFTFGFDEEDNITGAYADLNTVGWNWPSNPTSMFGDLGGGYHFMRLEGDFINSNADTAQYKHHMGTARDTSSTPFRFMANHFEAQLANSAISVDGDFSFDIEMNIEEWYQNPTRWDLNLYNAPIMPTYGAQRLLNANGPSVFSIRLN